MDADQYGISDMKTAVVMDHDSYVDSAPDTTSPMDVDSGSGSEPEGDETMTIASLIDYPKENHDEQQTQMESPTQLDDYDDDGGEFLFEE
jgi:hypothetical protein